MLRFAPARAARSTLASVLVVLAFSGCAASSEPGTESGDGVSGSIIVHAAASLTSAFEEAARRFSADEPDVDITFNFAGSSTLAAQLIEGAPGDIVATADTITMDTIEGSGALDTSPLVFATNSAVIAVERGNPLSIQTLEDLSAKDASVVLCAPEVPCGAYARRILENADIALTPRSYEDNVKAVLSKVSLGEADAGIVYATDVEGNASVDAVGIDPSVNITARYPIAALRNARNSSAARAFIDFLLSDEGQSILASFGFGRR